MRVTPSRPSRWPSKTPKAPARPPIDPETCLKIEEAITKVELARMGVHQGPPRSRARRRSLLLEALLTAARAAELVSVRAVGNPPPQRWSHWLLRPLRVKTLIDPNYDLAMYILMKDVRRTLRDRGLT